MKIRTGWFIPAAVAAALLATGSAWAQKPGGVLKIQHMDTPPSASIHEEATVSTAVPFMSALQQPRDVRPERRQEQLRIDRARPRHQMGDERRRQAGRLHPAPGREMARRQAVHRQGRGLHLRAAAGRGQAAAQSARGLVQQRREGDGRQRLRRHLPSQGAAALAAGAAGVGLHADLSLPRPVGRHAPQADRHRPVQARRVQDERGHQAGEESRLLEAGAALSRRHRVHHHRRPLDAHAVLRQRQVRHDLPDRPHGAAATRT